MDRPRHLVGVLETAVYHEAGQAEAMRCFYRDVLGLRLVSEWDRGAAFRVGTGIVLVFDREGTTRQRLPHGASGSGHACFLTLPDEYDAWKARLEAATVHIIEEAEWNGLRSFYFKDPADNVLEIADGDFWPS